MEMVLDINNMAPHEIIGAIAQLILALAVMGNMLLSWRNGRKIAEVHDATNSMKDELVVATKLVGEAKGREDERRETRERNGNHNV